MGLFGRPSEKLVQGYRNKLQIVRPEDPLPIRSRQVKLFYFNPERYQFPATTGQVASASLRLYANGQKHDFSIVCFSGLVDPNILSNAPCEADLQIPHLELRRGNLLSAEDVRLQRIGLISTSDFKIRAIDVTNFKIVPKRFSFPSLRDDPTTTLFDQPTAQRIDTARVAPVTPPDPPPSLKQADLQERLRWILTPPIHEVLSDPQLALPEKPFPYQTYGIKWLYDRYSGLLADEMGLGKTMQAVIAARLLWNDGFVKQILIICPKSLIPNWRKELRTWWPGIEWYTKVVEGDRQWFLRFATRDVVVKIINYESLQRELDWLKEKPPHHGLLIIDEAQRIKNPKSKSSQAVKALKADRRWALTGTPLENSINDLISIFGFLSPGLIKETDSAEKIRMTIKPYLLRRRQEEVLKELPEKIEQDIEVEMGDRQRKAYDRAEREGVIELNEKGDNITVTHVFALINKLRQICNFDQGSGESAKAELLLEELEEIVESGRKALIFGLFVDEQFGLKRLGKVIAESESFRKRTGPLELQGKIHARQREGIVERFQNDPNHPVLLLTYAVGGVGLNLQAANYVFLFDRWWNPAVEDQAIKRCHRLGQKHKVFVKRFYCKGTIEERILAKLAEKRRLFSHVIDEQRPADALGLSEEEIFSLFNLTVRPRCTSQTGAPTQLVIENVDHKEFENLVAMIYEKDGYKVKVTGRSHDGGIVILAERVSGGGKDRIVVQCKHQKQNVGRPVLQQLWGVLNSDHSITRCDLVTSAGFTPEAREFAVGKRLILIDRSKLEELARRHNVAQFVSL